jgi:hypothetical protein
MTKVKNENTNKTKSTTLKNRFYGARPSFIVFLSLSSPRSKHDWPFTVGC